MAADDEQQAETFADTLALSSLFSNCVEAVGLILPFHEGRKSESLLLARIAIQQSRLLCWGETLGVTSPPLSSGITHAVPRLAGATNPDPEQPINFAVRDGRLDERANRIRIEEALHGILDPIFQPDHAELRKTYGLKYFKASRLTEQPMLNILRLEAFREKVALLEDVTQNFERPLPRKKSRHLMPHWYIEDAGLFAEYLRVTTENIDYLIKFMDLQPQVDRAMKMDLRAMGWHPSDAQIDLVRTGQKLNVLREATATQYPEYSAAATEALDNVLGVWKGMQGYTAADRPHNPVISETRLHTTAEMTARLEELKREKEARGGVFAFRPKFLRKRSAKVEAGGDERRKSYDESLQRPESSLPTSLTEPARASLDPPRSQSVHAMTEKEFDKSNGPVEFADLARMPTSGSTISRHDMYKGMFRIETKNH